MRVPARDLGILFVGSRKGYRDLWCAHLEAAGLPLHRRFTDQSRANSLGTEDYLQLLKRARLVFNCSLVSSRAQQTNFRIYEAMSARAPLLELDFPGMRDYFVPYVHYAPFANTHEMISTARFLLKHRDVAERMAEQAFAWYQGHFAGPHFWRRLVAELDAV